MTAPTGKVTHDEPKIERVLAPRGVTRGHVVTAVGVLRTRWAESWTLDSLAEEVHLSRSQLVRAFGAVGLQT
jgi:transcriptional regulator GlxA family with amidase domain